MAHQEYHLNFEGYWRDVNINGLPKASGIYCVYCCTYNNEQKNLSIRELIYIGEATDINDRITKHEKWEDWEKRLKSGECICFSYAKIDRTNRERCEAAMINKHKPPINTEYRDNFPYDDTTIELEGKTSLLHDDFKVIRKDQ